MATKKSDFDKVLSAWDILVIAFGAMIGWGWVVSTGDWIMKGGVIGAMLGFAIGGVMVFFVGLTYAELTSAMPQCGGEHVFSYKAMGPLGSFICTWMIVLGYVSVVCFEVCALPTIITYIYPDFLAGYLYTIEGFDIYASWLAVAIVVALIITAVNIVGVKTAAILQTILTVIIGLVGILLIAASALTGNMANLDGQLFMGLTDADMLKGTLAVAVVTPFYFIGFDVIPQAAEEITVSLKKIGRILILSIILAVVFYALIIFGVGHVMNNNEIALSMKGAGGLVTADAMSVAFGSSVMAKVLIIGGLCGILTSWNSFLIGGSRAMYSMGESYMIPHTFAKLHKKYKTPINALLLIGLLSIIAPFFGRKMLVWVVDAGNFGCCMAYCMVAISFVILRKKAPQMPRPYKVKHYKLVGVMAILMSGFMVVMYIIPGSGATLVPQEWAMVGIWCVLGVLFGVYCKVKYGEKFASHVDVATVAAVPGEEAADLAFGQAMAAAMHDVESDGPVHYVAEPLQFSLNLSMPLVFGSGKSKEIGNYVKRYGSNALIVTDASTGQQPLMTSITESLEEAGLSYHLFAHSKDASPQVTIDSAVNAIQENTCDLVLAVGSNQVMTCAKKIVASAATKVSLACVPTSYAAEHCFGGIPAAQVIVADPAIMTDMSPSSRAKTGFASLCYCIGAYMSSASQPLSDVLALYAIGLLHDYLPAVCDGRGDQGAWEKVVLAGMVAGMVSAETGNPIQQGLQRIAKQLQSKVSEKVLLAVMPVILREMAAKDPFKYGKLARILGGFTSDDCAARLVHLTNELHLEYQLADLDLSDSDIARMAEAFMGRKTKISDAGNPLPSTPSTGILNPV